MIDVLSTLVGFFPWHKESAVFDILSHSILDSLEFIQDLQS